MRLLKKGSCFNVFENAIFGSLSAIYWKRSIYSILRMIYTYVE